MRNLKNAQEFANHILFNRIVYVDPNGQEVSPDMIGLDPFSIVFNAGGQNVFNADGTVNGELYTATFQNALNGFVNELQMLCTEVSEQGIDGADRDIILAQLNEIENVVGRLREMVI